MEPSADGWGGVQKENLMVELVLWERCEHRRDARGNCRDSDGWLMVDCPGGRETVLDPEQVVTIPALAHWSFGYETLSLPLRTVIDALKEEE